MSNNYSFADGVADGARNLALMDAENDASDYKRRAKKLENELKEVQTELEKQRSDSKKLVQAWVQHAHTKTGESEAAKALLRSVFPKYLADVPVEKRVAANRKILSEARADLEKIKTKFDFDILEFIQKAWSSPKMSELNNLVKLISPPPPTPPALQLPLDPGAPKKPGEVLDAATTTFLIFSKTAWQFDGVTFKTLDAATAARDQAHKLWVQKTLSYENEMFRLTSAAKSSFEQEKIDFQILKSAYLKDWGDYIEQ